MAFEARSESECAKCEDDIVIGELIRYEGDRVVHDECPDPTSLARARAHRKRPVCPRCWLLTPCGCDDN